MTQTKKGRVEPVNYRTTKIPTGNDIPLFVANEFGDFYKAMFATQVEKEKMKTVFLEYAWDMAWCDPCAADPLQPEELRELGVWWLDEGTGMMLPGRRAMPPQAVNAYVTRMHVRYDAKTFPEDLVLQVTEDRQNFQGRYVMRHPWNEEADCEEATAYYQDLTKRFEKEAKTLANLTGWDISDIRKKMEENGQSFDMKPHKDERPWWEQMWDNG